MDEKKLFIIMRVVLITCIVLLIGATILAIVGYNKLYQSRAIRDSGRVDEYSRQAGRITEFAEQIGNGLGGIHESIGSIKGKLAGNTTDIRSFATRLQEIAGIVETMENDNARLRSYVRDFINDNSDSYSYEIKEVSYGTN